MVQIRRLHWLLLGISIAAVSFSAILARWAQAEQIPSLVIAFYRLLFALLMLAPWALRRGPELRSLTLRELGALAAVGLFLAAHFATWITSLELTSVASSAVIVATEALWVPLGAAFLLREHVSGRLWLGVAIAFAGSLLLVTGDSEETRFGGQALVGDFLALAGAVAASLYFLAGRRLRQRHSLIVYAVVVYAFTALFLLLMVLARDLPLLGYSPKGVGVLVLFAFFPMILGHTIINYLLKWVPPHYISTTILFEPVVSAALAIPLLGEPISLFVLIGGSIILFGLSLAVSSEKRPTLAEAPLAP